MIKYVFLKVNINMVRCSTIICYQFTCNQPHLLSASFANSLTCFHLICYQFTCYQLTCYQFHCYQFTCYQFTCYQFTCYQFTCYLFHFLSPHLLCSLNCYLVNLLSGLTCYQNVCSSVSTAIKPVLSCYQKLVAF